MPVTAKCSLRDAVRFKEGEKNQSRGEKPITKKPRRNHTHGATMALA
jgi:hypothetical protein